MHLMGIGDEAGGGLDFQIKAAQELGWKFIEMRGADCGDQAHIDALPAFWVGLMYDDAALDAAQGAQVAQAQALQALVTSIGVDHADYLGDTRESVSFEKAGIFRQGKPALCGDLNPPQPLLDKVRELGCPFFLRGRDFDLASTARHWQWRGVDARGGVVELQDLPLLDLPMENAALALQAYQIFTDNVLEISLLNLATGAYRVIKRDARLLGAATLGGAHAMGIDVGPDRTGYLAVGALADLTFFDVPAGPDAVPELVEHGAGRTAATIVSGEVRFAIDSFDRAAVTPETGGVS